MSRQIRQNVPSDFGTGGAGLTPEGSSVAAATPSGAAAPSFGTPNLGPNPDLATVLWALLARVAPAVATYTALAAFGAGPAPSNALDRQDGMIILVEQDNTLWYWNATATSGRAANDAPATGRWQQIGGTGAGASPVVAQQTSVANTDANTTLTAAQVTGAAHVDVHMTGTLTAGRTLTTPTATQIIGAIPAPVVGANYLLRLVNAQAGAFAFTTTAGAGVTLAGPGAQTIAQNTWREYLVSITAIGTPAVTMKSLATGTFS